MSLYCVTIGNDECSKDFSKNYLYCTKINKNSFN